jgi:hypothetical protein
MKIYYSIVAVIFLVAYAIFHFGFRSGGEGRLYRINDRIAFELNDPAEFYNGIAIRSYHRTNAFVRFICGDCELDSKGDVDMVNVNYRQGDFVYTDVPMHEIALTDIVNVRTGEAVNVAAANNFKNGDDVSKLDEYRIRGLAPAQENRLTQEYVTANFAGLSTFIDRCLYANLIFAAVALILAFPTLWLEVAAGMFDGDGNDSGL